MTPSNSSSVHLENSHPSQKQNSNQKSNRSKSSTPSSVILETSPASQSSKSSGNTKHSFKSNSSAKSSISNSSNAPRHAMKIASHTKGSRSPDSHHIQHSQHSSIDSKSSTALKSRDPSDEQLYQQYIELRSEQSKHSNCSEPHSDHSTHSIHSHPSKHSEVSQHSKDSKPFNEMSKHSSYSKSSDSRDSHHQSNFSSAGCIQDEHNHENHESENHNSSHQHQMKKFEGLFEIINTILKHYELPHHIIDPSQLSSPSLYVICLEHLTQKRIHGIVRKPVSDIHHLSNMEAVVSYISSILGHPLSINVKEIYSGDLKAIESIVNHIEKIRRIVWGSFLKRKKVKRIKKSSQLDTKDARTTSTQSSCRSDMESISYYHPSNNHQIDHPSQKESRQHNVHEESVQVNTYIPLNERHYDQYINQRMQFVSLQESSSHTNSRNNNRRNNYHAIIDDSNTSIHSSEPSILKEKSEESYALIGHEHSVENSPTSHDTPSILQEAPLYEGSPVDSDASTRLSDDFPFRAKPVKRPKEPIPSNVFSDIKDRNGIKDEGGVLSKGYNTCYEFKRKDSIPSSQDTHLSGAEYLEAPRLPPSRAKSATQKRSHANQRKKRPSSANPYRDLYKPFIKKFAQNEKGIATLMELEDMQRRLQSIKRDKKIETLRRKRWDEQQEEAFRASLYNRRAHEENLMRKIYKEMLKIEKERLCLENAFEREQTLRYQAEAKKRMQATNNYFRDQMEMIKEEISTKDRLLSKEAQKWALKRLGKEAKKRNWSKADVRRLKNAVAEQAKYQNQMSGDAVSKRILKQFAV